MHLSGWILLSTLALPGLAAGQGTLKPVTQATIESLQMPAWLERDGRSEPLAIGMAVINGDQIRTGATARVYLQLAEGSRVKLGEHAALKFYSRSLQPASTFKGALDVLSGAFRFTTRAVQKMRGQRDLSIRVRTATIGIRGTDVWGKADAERDLVLLIEGQIEVRHAGVTFEMIEPLTYFSAPRNAPPLPLRKVDPESFQQWARETEILPGDGAAQRGGLWKVLLVRAGEQGEALAAYDKARNAGYAAQVRVRSASGKGGPWDYEVILPQLASEREAAVVADKVKAQLGFDALPAR